MLLSWVDRAACRNYPDPDLWFKRYDKSAGTAKYICDHCPVLMECRSYSLTVRLNSGPNTLHGVWGGLTKGDRRRKKVAEERLDEALEILWKENNLRPLMMS